MVDNRGTMPVGVGGGIKVFSYVIAILSSYVPQTVFFVVLSTGASNVLCGADFLIEAPSSLGHHTMGTSMGRAHCNG